MDSKAPLVEATPRRHTLKLPSTILVVSILTATLIVFATAQWDLGRVGVQSTNIHEPPVDAQSVLAQCVSLRAKPGPPQDFLARDESDRYEEGTGSTLIRNAKIFTGEKNGTVVIHGDLYLDKGVIKGVGRVPRHLYEGRDNLKTINANGAWITPGLVDLHSHLGILSTPMTSGANDLNSRHGPILPWLRSVDAFNTHDESFQLAMAGGVTSVQVLPGSSNAIGGQAYIMKLRKTSERSTSSMIVEPPNELKNSGSRTPRWRHMKHACGENLKKYGNRMDSNWSLRSAYHEARKVKDAQDDYCAKAEAGLWGELTGPFPKSLQWEALVDVLRGRVKLSAHCYEAVDLDSMIRLSNEFKFPIASFHHAADGYLVPDLLKQTYEGTPSVALFATNYRYKREAFRGSEFAPRILADSGIPVVLKSDHPFMNSRYLLYEAQQAHHFGLPAHLALAAVTSVPATAAGLVHRIGVLNVGADADVVMWDSHPLQLGATPINVWVDGVLQIPIPPKGDEDTRVEVGVGKDGEEWTKVPDAPNWDKERKRTLQWDGLPPLKGRKQSGKVLFKNVKYVWKSRPSGFTQELVAQSNGEMGSGSVLVDNGRITCMGGEACLGSLTDDIPTIDLMEGSISPGLMTYGSPLGLEEIASEPSTGDGEPYDAFTRKIPEVLHDVGNTLRAMDGLIFNTRNALTAYRSGVTMATTSLSKPFYPSGSGTHVISGLSVTFNVGASNVIERGAIVQDISALHINVGRPGPLVGQRSVSVTSQIGGLRRLLYGWEARDEETGHWFRKAAEGVVPLVIEVHSLDIMASLLIMKAEVEDKIGSTMRMVFSGATEAHLLAREIAEEGVGVILTPTRPFPETWEERRILPGPPLSNDTALVKLLETGVRVGLGVRSASEARNTRFDLQWAILESNGRISKHQALNMVTKDLEELLNVREVEDEARDMVAFSGGDIFDQSSKVAGIISPRRDIVELF